MSYKKVAKWETVEVMACDFCEKPLSIYIAIQFSINSSLPFCDMGCLSNFASLHKDDNIEMLRSFHNRPHTD